MESRYVTASAVLEAVRDTTEFLALKDESLDVNSIGLFGNHPLKVAISWGDLNAVNLLLAAGAKLDEQNEGGNTALHHALTMGAFKIAKRLIELGANQHIRNTEGKLARELCWHEEWSGLGLTAD